MKNKIDIIVFYLIIAIALFHGSPLRAVEDTAAVKISQERKIDDVRFEYFARILSYNNYDEANKNIQLGVDVNISNSKGRTPLMISSNSLNYQISRLLVEKGAKINVQDDHGITPLMEAVNWRSNLALVRFLVENGADINIQDYNGLTALMRAANWPSKFQVVRFLLANGAYAGVADKSGKTAFEIAESNNNYMTANLLKEFMNKKIVLKPTIKIKHDEKLNNNLLIAIEKENYESVEILLSLGADPNYNPPGKKSVLEIAVSKNNIKIVELLIDNYSAINKDHHSDDSAALNEAIINENIDLIKLILANGPMTSYEVMKNSIYAKDTEIIKLLLNYEDSRFLYKIWQESYRNNLIKGIIIDNKVNALELFIKKGLEVNYVDKWRNDISYLAIASKLGCFDCARLLIENGAKIDLCDNYGFNPLIYAAWYSHINIVRLLLEKGANVNFRTVDGTTALMFASMAGHIDIVKLLLEKGADIDLKNENGVNALIEAMTSVRTEAVEVLKSSGADFTAAIELLQYKKTIGTNINEKDRFGASIIIKAAQENNFEKVKLLIDMGANVNDCIDNLNNNSYRDYHNKTALYYATANNNDEMVKLLIEKGVKPSKINESENPVLINSIFHKNYFIIKFLLDNKFNMNVNFQHKNSISPSETPLSEALNDRKIINLLIEYGADLNLPVCDRYNDGELTPLTLVLKSKNYELANFLIDKGADVNYKIKKTDIYCAFGCDEFASSNFLENSIECIIKKLLDLKNPYYYENYTNSRTAINEAAKSGNIDSIKLLHRRGADIFEKTDWGWTNLMLCIRSKNMDSINYFIDNKIEVATISAEGLKWSALLEAVKFFDEPDIIDLLVKKGADVNQKSVSGWTPLMFAVRVNKIKLIKRLHQLGADLNSVNESSMTALDIAQTLNYTDIIEFLKSSGANNESEKK